MSKQLSSLEHQQRLVLQSGLFDGGWYLEQYPDVRSLGIDPAEHYLRWGASMGRDPSPRFSTRHYLKVNPDVAASRRNPLVHYVAYGRKERRSILPHNLKQADVAVHVDIVVPVFNALSDVQRCLLSIDARRDGCEVRTIVVNDGSDAETGLWLRAFCDKAGFELIEHEGNKGYTRAVNTGLRASTAPYVVTLNSDTVVTRGWLKGLLRCMGSADNIGIAGPLSNAASWQNVPDLLGKDGTFAVNALPEDVSPDEMAAMVGRVSTRAYPRMSFINGFCFMVKREVINTIGVMDEQNFPVGYGEENDFCIRAADAGYELAVADDAYVFHAKSKSFGHEKRKELSRLGSETLRNKHTAGKFQQLVAQVKDTRELDKVRLRIRDALRHRDHAEVVPDPLSMRVLFLLPVRGGGGGAHSVVQEVVAMRRLGIHASAAVRKEHLEGFRLQYADIADIGEVLLGFSDDRLLEVADGFDVVVATIFSSMRMVKAITDALPHILPAYYVQDYEPLFFEEMTANWKRAHESYELVAGAVLFAKTHWLVNKVKAEHGIDVRKVEPSIDHAVYKPTAAVNDGRVHLAAMIRPQTPRRGADRTMRVLARVAEIHRDKVAVHIFGCDDAGLEGLQSGFAFDNSGVLDRPGVAALLARSHIFIDLSDYQAFGRTALEAMACGCTSAVPVHGGADEYAIDGINALVVDSFDEDECVRRLDGLIRSDAELAAMRLSALKTASEYSVHKAAISEIGLLSVELAHRRRLYPAPVRKRLVLIPAVRKDGSTPTGSAWVRCLLPYASEGVRRDWVITRGSRRNLPMAGSADVAILQRDATGIALPELEKWLTAWRDAGGAFVYEVDDDLLDGEGLRRRGFTADVDEVTKSVTWLAGKADLVTVSTEQLAQRLRSFNSRVHVVPNRLDRGLWRLTAPQPHQDLRTQRGGNAPIKIGYIGTPSHDLDLSMIAEAVKRIEKEFGERVQVEIIGAFEQRRSPFGKCVSLPRRNDYPSFVDWLFQRVDWDIALLPLADDRFNASKSHLKFLEYAALNLAIVCSDVPTYRSVATDRSNSLVVPNSTEAWYQALCELILDRDLRHELAARAYALVEGCHTIDNEPMYSRVLSSVGPPLDHASGRAHDQMHPACDAGLGVQATP